MRALCLLCLACLPLPLAAQEPPADASEITRNLIYHPARKIEFAADRVIFRADTFMYEYSAQGARWSVRAEKFDANLKPLARFVTSSGTVYSFKGDVQDNGGLLAILRGEEQIARLMLWTRDQLAAYWWPIEHAAQPELRDRDFVRNIDVAEPEVGAAAEDGAVLWLGIGFYNGEGSLGIGTLIRLDTKTGEARALQPLELGDSSVSHIVAAGGALWIGTYRQGEDHSAAAHGLLRLDPASGEARQVWAPSRATPGRMITALAAQGESLWAATDEGFCSITLADAKPTCWRLVPIVKLAAPTPVAIRPGMAPRGRLAPDEYDVLWVNTAFLEVATPDAVEGWIPIEDVQDGKKNDFECAPYLLESDRTAPGPLRLLKQPGGDPMGGALVYRAEVEAAGPPDKDGWMRGRAKIGWLSRGQLQIELTIRPASP